MPRTLSSDSVITETTEAPKDSEAPSEAKGSRPRIRLRCTGRGRATSETVAVDVSVSETAVCASIDVEGSEEGTEHRSLGA